jgi:hypothetical protein
VEDPRRLKVIFLSFITNLLLKTPIFDKLLIEWQIMLPKMDPQPRKPHEKIMLEIPEWLFFLMDPDVAITNSS